jgi:hypothetical protein
MLRLAAAQLREQRRVAPDKRLVWVDIGGGTGAYILRSWSRVPHSFLKSYRLEYRGDGSVYAP